ncbi:MAG: HAMP domain-containing sensor histidine kinase [Gammaproteobacteria bacterium]|nr:HAMP domain-containing sensor histidine kinase [Gammaproteobacteria bacterium]
MIGIGGLPPIHRSLIGQTTLLSLALLVLGVTLLVFLPVLTMERPDPLQRTLYLAVGAAAQAQMKADTPLRTLLETKEIRAVMAANDRFRLYVQRGAEDFQIGMSPRWTHAFSLPDLLFAAESPDRNRVSSFASFEFNEDGAVGRSGYRRSGGQYYYYEVGGIEVAVKQATGLLAGLSPALFWAWFKDYLAVGSAILAGVLLVLFLLVRSFRRLANIAQSLGPQAPGRLLPEKGLPIEIVPMVRAINRLIRRVERTNEEQAFFISAAAHELRTPLAVLRTRLENLPDGADKDDLRNDLRRMARLVDQLLRLMSVRNKSAPSSAVNLVEVARNVVAERAPIVIGQGVEIDLDAASETVQVDGDKCLLEVALANLVDNALSFSKSGQTLQVKVGPKRCVTVKDQGPGVPAAELENIFRPFAKSPPNRQGHGLGLAITRSIMALHGGSVRAANRKRGGASFALRF